MTLTMTSTKALGQPVPPFTSHAISMSLPTWRDNIDYEEGEKRVMDVLVNGYPRFYIQKNIEKVSLLHMLLILDLKRNPASEHLREEIRTAG